MGKRMASGQLDRDQVENESDEFKEDATGDADHVDSAAQIAQRKVVKIKRRVPPADEAKNG